MSFEQVDNFQYALLFAFHPDGLEEDEDIDERFLAIWTIFLSMSGWTNDEYWQHFDENHKCEECKKENAEISQKLNKEIN